MDRTKRQSGQRRHNYICCGGLKTIVGWGMILLLLLSGCIDVPTGKATFEEELTVHCLLRTDAGPSEVYVERTLDINDPATDNSVSGATVKLSGEGREAMLIERSSRPGVYDCLVQFPIRNGSTYTLDVVAPSGDSISAMTTVPGHFQILNPAIKDTFDHRKDLRLTWSSSSGAEEYHVLTEVACDGNRWDLVYYVFSDTTLIIPAWQFDIDIPFECTELWVTIYAVDENYAGYTRSDSGDPNSPDVNHILGAKGVFGSATNTFSFFYIK